MSTNTRYELYPVRTLSLTINSSRLLDRPRPQEFIPPPPPHTPSVPGHGPSLFSATTKKTPRRVADGNRTHSKRILKVESCLDVATRYHIPVRSGIDSTAINCQKKVYTSLIHYQKKVYTSLIHYQKRGASNKQHKSKHKSLTGIEHIKTILGCSNNLSYP